MRGISDWFKYERLHHYPELAAFDPPQALKRLKAYEIEERDACQPWLNRINTLIVLLILSWGGLAVFLASRNNSLWGLVGHTLALFAQLPAWIFRYVLYRRIHRRVQARVAEELATGRLWSCIHCGYDLRGSNDQCPECGQPVKQNRVETGA